MLKQKISILIPLGIIAILLIYCWLVILTTDILAVWRHYIGLIFFIVLVFLFFKNLRATIIGTGVYLLLGTFNLLAVTPEISVSWVRIGAIDTPHVQLLSLGIFILYFILNNGFLIDIYLDQKEKKPSDKKLSE